MSPVFSSKFQFQLWARTDKSMEEAIRFLKQHQNSKGDWLITATVQNPDTPEEQRIPLVDLCWASDA